MKNLFVSYELATLLKEKGFNENCISSYWNTPPHTIRFVGLKQNGDLWGNSNKPNSIFVEESRDSLGKVITQKFYPYTSAPMYQEVIDWLMDEHLFFVSVNCTEWMHTFVGNVQTENGSVSIAPCHDYYEALNGAIELALNSIENE